MHCAKQQTTYRLFSAHRKTSGLDRFTQEVHDHDLGRLHSSTQTDLAGTHQDSHASFRVQAYSRVSRRACSFRNSQRSVLWFGAYQSRGVWSDKTPRKKELLSCQTLVMHDLQVPSVDLKPSPNDCELHENFVAFRKMTKVKLLTHRNEILYFMY